MKEKNYYSIKQKHLQWREQVTKDFRDLLGWYVNYFIIFSKKVALKILGGFKEYFVH